MLQGPVGGNWIGHGTGAVDNAMTMTGAQLPHFRVCSFEGTLSLAKVALEDELVPLDVTLEAVSIPFFVTWYFPNYEFAFDKTDRALAPGALRSQ